MENVTFTMADQHLYGSAFYDFLKLRKRLFVDQLGWDIPHNDTVEMDQYDNPEASYSVVLKDGDVVGGARVMPTSTVWGEHTYMLGDARKGNFSGIPEDIMLMDVRRADVWEVTRLVVSDALTTHSERNTCLAAIVNGFTEAAAAGGATRLMSLSPLAMARALRQLGYGAERVGEPYRNEDGRQYAVLSMPVHRMQPGTPRATHRPGPMAVHAPQTR